MVVVGESAALLLPLQASIEVIRRWRESEITHGRVAMLAALGFIVGEQLGEYVTASHCLHVPSSNPQPPLPSANALPPSLDPTSPSAHPALSSSLSALLSPHLPHQHCLT